MASKKVTKKVVKKPTDLEKTISMIEKARENVICKIGNGVANLGEEDGVMDDIGHALDRYVDSIDNSLSNLSDVLKIIKDSFSFRDKVIAKLTLK